MVRIKPSAMNLFVNFRLAGAEKSGKPEIYFAEIRHLDAGLYKKYFSRKAAGLIVKMNDRRAPAARKLVGGFEGFNKRGFF